MAKQLSMEEEVWDKKKIAVAVIAFIFLIAGFIFARNYFLPKKGATIKQTGVEGAQTMKLPSVQMPNYSQEVQQKIQQLKDQVTNINVGEIASSSPQVQQIMQEIQNLPNLPKSVAKEACINLCSKL